MFAPLTWFWKEMDAVSEHDAIHTYLETVAGQIRWKRARNIVIPELAQHLEDQHAAFAAEGHENAAQLAVEEMGDPVPVGMELDRLHRPQPQWSLIVLTIFFTMLGTCLRIWLTREYVHPILLQRTLFSLILGCSALLAGHLLDCPRLGRHGRTIYLLTLGVSILVLFTSPVANGISYYTRYVILCYPVAYAFWLFTWRGQGWIGLFFSLLGGIPLGLFCLSAPYFFGLLIFSVTVFALCASAAWNDWFQIGRRKSLICVISCTLFFGGAALRYAISCDYMIQRLITAVHPEQDPFGLGYRALAIREALADSQWMGTRLDNPLPLDQTLPGYDSDAFLTAMVYQLGWLPSLLIISIFMVLIIFLLSRCLKQKCYLGKWVVFSVVITLSLQAGCSILWSFGYTLVDASFPLIVGNLNTLINMFLIGLALSVFRGEHIFRDSVCPAQPQFPRYRIKIIFQKISP